MRVLFIGGTGVISSSCSRIAIENGIDLWLLNRGLRLDRAPEAASLVNGDIDAPSPQLLKFLESNQWDCVVNWVVTKPQDAVRDIRLFRNRTDHYIFISSAAVYQTPQSGHHIVETDAVGNDVWTYAQDKIACERAYAKAAADGFPVTVVRPGHTYNDFTFPTNVAGLGYGLVERLREGKKILIHDDGSHQWVLTHSDDFGTGFIGLMGRKDVVGETFHITSSEVLTWRSILDTIANAVGVEPKYVSMPSDLINILEPSIGGPIVGNRARNMVFDNRKIKFFVPSFRPEISFRTGIRRVLQWHEQNPDKIWFDQSVMATIDRLLAKKGLPE